MQKKQAQEAKGFTLFLTLSSRSVFEVNMQGRFSFLSSLEC